LPLSHLSLCVLPFKTSLHLAAPSEHLNAHPPRTVHGSPGDGMAVQAKSARAATAAKAAKAASAGSMLGLVAGFFFLLVIELRNVKIVRVLSSLVNLCSV